MHQFNVADGEGANFNVLIYISYMLLVNFKEPTLKPYDPINIIYLLIGLLICICKATKLKLSECSGVKVQEFPQRWSEKYSEI